MKVLHLNSSPRGADSHSLQLAELFIRELAKKHSLEVDRYDLFEDELPAFGELATGAKMSLFTGTAATEEQQQEWAKIKQVFERFAAADTYVINVPLWNNGVPYILKQFIDVVTQPGWSFGFDMEKGYTGLLKNKKACVIHTSGVYREGISPAFGSDFCSPYINDWLKFVGVETIEQINFAPTVVNPEFGLTKASAQKQATDIAARL